MKATAPVVEKTAETKTAAPVVEKTADTSATAPVAETAPVTETTAEPMRLSIAPILVSDVIAAYFNEKAMALGKTIKRLTVGDVLPGFSPGTDRFYVSSLLKQHKENLGGKSKIVVLQEQLDKVAADFSALQAKVRESIAILKDENRTVELSCDNACDVLLKAIDSDSLESASL